jgi:AraC-like DNA-binding protein
VQNHCIILQTIDRYRSRERRGHMESFSLPQVAGEAQRAQANRQELVARIARAIRDDGRVEPLKGLYLARSSSRIGPVYGVSEPSFCVIAQGSKEVFLGEDRYQYDPAHYLLTTVELPVVSHIREASTEQPYLSVRLQLDPTLAGSVLVETELPSPRGAGEVKAIDVSPLDASLLDAVLRLIRLLDSPADARVLAPLVTREIVYRLLVGAQGARLRHIAVLGGDTHRIARAVDLLRKDFRKPLRMERIAQALGMSVSGLHHQFKAVTAMSPLQYQKRLRLQEARRLMLSEHLDAAGAGSRVGYDDAAHFNREYKSLFGLPPMRDVERLREAAGTSTLQEVSRGQ